MTTKSASTPASPLSHARIITVAVTKAVTAVTKPAVTAVKNNLNPPQRNPVKLQEVAPARVMKPGKSRDRAAPRDPAGKLDLEVAFQEVDLQNGNRANIAICSRSSSNSLSLWNSNLRKSSLNGSTSPKLLLLKISI